MSDYNLTLFETCEFLNRSKKSISRYVRRGLLHPEKVKSQQGTLEYRFSKADIEAFKAQEAGKADQTGHDTGDRTGQTGHKEPIRKAEFLENKDFKRQTEETRQDTPKQTGHGRQDKTGHDSEIINLLKETTGILKEQLVKKDEQIKDLGGKIDQLIERDRETNILIGQLQSKVLILEQPKEAINADIVEQTRQDTPDKTIKPLKEKKTKPKAEAKTPEKKGFWHIIFK